MSSNWLAFHPIFTALSLKAYAWPAWRQRKFTTTSHAKFRSPLIFAVLAVKSTGHLATLTDIFQRISA
jgi:hypothetical protein